MTDRQETLREALTRLVKAWDDGTTQDASKWRSADREIDVALEQARAAIEAEAREQEHNVAEADVECNSKIRDAEQRGRAEALREAADRVRALPVMQGTQYAIHREYVLAILTETYP